MQFEWDESKRQRNLEKHGVDFKDACRIFSGTVSLKYSPRVEIRYLAIGKVQDLFFAVTFAQRGQHVRIISARKANRREIRAYLQLHG